MSEAERHPDMDTYLVDRAEQIASRLLSLQTSHPSFEIKNGHFWLRHHLEYNGEFEEVNFEYFARARTPHLSAAEKLLILFAREEVDFPLLSIEIKHDGEYHSAVGLIPRESYARNGLIYEASNRFVFSQSGKAYRVDSLVESKRRYSDDELEWMSPMESDPPEETELGTRVNQLDPDDFEKIEMYLNQIEYFELDSLN